MSHTAELIAVGTELLLGNIANTNAQTISQALSALGINVFWHTVVGDNPQRLREALDIARRRADILITTGGLGPTYDDLTKQTICAAFDQPLVLHPDILEEIRVFYESALHVPMPENNAQQAMLPQGCTVFDNPVGTAPGCAFSCNGVHVLMLPGPPHEMETMLRRCAIPYLRRLSQEVIVSRDIMTFGMGESSVDQLLHETMSHMENPTLATYAKPCEVRLRATAKAADTAQAEAMLSPVVEQVRTALGDIVYGESGIRMPVSFKGAPSDSGHRRELHRWPGGPAHHRPARRLRRVPGRRGQLLDGNQGRRTGRSPGNSGSVRRRLGTDRPGHGPGGPSDYRGGSGGLRHRSGRP